MRQRQSLRLVAFPTPARSEFSKPRHACHAGACRTLRRQTEKSALSITSSMSLAENRNFLRSTGHPRPVHEFKIYNHLSTQPLPVPSHLQPETRLSSWNRGMLSSPAAPPQPPPGTPTLKDSSMQETDSYLNLVPVADVRAIRPCVCRTLWEDEVKSG